MSAIFLSHSSADKALAVSVCEKLRDWKYPSVFLDFDPAFGIPAGRDWERELYVQLRSCDAVIVLCSKASMASSWCFAEITHAKALGKRLFPVRVDDCEVHRLLAEFQVIDARTSMDDALGRLRHGLESAGLSSKDMFAWDRSRPPYPGLGTFEVADAGVYFGRTRDIQSILEKLTSWRTLPGTRLALILGASGSGKSSLVRAGLLPRLAREPERWLVLDPMRPQGRPIEQLATVLDAALTRAGKPMGWRRIREILLAEEAVRDRELQDLITDLRTGTGHLGATIVITLDQAEELFTLSPPADTDQFLAALKACVGLRGDGVLAVATLRSDFLAAWQARPAEVKPALESITLEQMGRDNFREIVSRPAMLAAVDLEPELIEAMVDDTGTQDALPLLAFALNTLWTKHEARERWTRDMYRAELGGIHGAIATAAEKLLAEQKPADAELLLLRRAFAAMVRVNDADQYVRRPARWQDLPERVRPLLEHFAKIRLLVIGGESEGARTVEVAHEALFRSWNRLAAWLNEDREFFLWRRRLEAAVQAWTGQRDASLLWRGAPLAQAEKYLVERPEFLDPVEREFIDTALVERRALERRRKRSVVALAAGLVAALGLAIFAGLQWKNAREQTQVAAEQSRRALARQLAREAELTFDDSAQSLTVSTLLAIESLNLFWTPDAFETLYSRMDLLPQPPLRSWPAHDKPITSMALSRDGRFLASTDLRDLAVWDLASGKELRRFKPKGHSLGEGHRNPIALSAEGKWLVAACEEQLCIWNVEEGVEFPRVRNTALVMSLDFSPDGKELLVPGRGDGVRYEVGTWRELGRVGSESGKQTFAAAYAPEDFQSKKSIVMATPAGLQWSPREVSLLSDPGKGFESVAFSPDGATFVAGVQGSSFEIAVFELIFPGQIFHIAHHPEKFNFRTLSVGDGGKFISAAPSARVWMNQREVLRLDDEVLTQRIGREDQLVSGYSGEIQIRDLNGPRRELARFNRAGAVIDVDFAADGKSFAIASTEGIDVTGFDDHRQRAKVSLGAEPSGVRLSMEGQLAASWSAARAFLIDTKAGTVVHTQDGETNVNSAAFNADASTLAVARYDGVQLMQTSEPFRQIEIKQGADEVGFSPDGKWVATYSAFEDCRVIHARYKLLEVRDSKTGASVALRSNRNQICGDRGASPQFEPRGDEKLLDQGETWLRGEAPMSTADGHLQVSASGEIREVSSGRELQILSTGAQPPDRAVLSKDGRWLLTGGKDGVARIWPVTAADVIAVACARLKRNLSAEEWKKYRPDSPMSATCKNLPLANTPDAN